MKKVIFAFVVAIAFASCNTDMPTETPTTIVVVDTCAATTDTVVVEATGTTGDTVVVK